jgi:hypothetical protein
MYAFDSVHYPHSMFLKSYCYIELLLSPSKSQQHLVVHNKILCHILNLLNDRVSTIT